MTNIGLSFFVAFGIFVNLAVPDLVSPADVRDGVFGPPLRVEIDSTVDAMVLLAGVTATLPSVDRIDRGGFSPLAEIVVRSSLVADPVAADRRAARDRSVSVGIEADARFVDLVGLDEPLRFVVADLSASVVR